ncbi:DUF6985 domain-containing protein [Terasakiispira papahanaumokuakeensis]|uniref:DUF6985 domain-containing protein n=1 Tax=Terasakiispira papahanaumokuakeensis TaxID=197479 RepID=UPI001C48CE64|nr:hypothetical protein [Terasakiispira papahanaumokuakeensis]
MLKFELSVGTISIDDRYDECFTDPIKVAFLDDKECEFLIENYKDDKVKEDFQKAINNFINLDKSVLYGVSGLVYQYYLKTLKYLSPEDDGYVEIERPQDVWQFVRFGCEPAVSRRDDDNTIYISLVCSCDWEREHGLQLVFKDGRYVNKLGGYDGHLTHSDAFDDESLEGVIYR